MQEIDGALTDGQRKRIATLVKDGRRVALSIGWDDSGRLDVDVLDVELLAREPDFSGGA